MTPLMPLMTMPTRHWLSAGLMLLTPLAQTLAQDLGPNDPSVIRQDHLRRLEQTAPPKPVPPSVAPSAQRSVAPPSAVVVSFSEIQFSASKLLSPEELRAAGEPYLARALGSADVQALLDDIAALYTAKGVLTALPVLPQQDLQSGVLRVLLVEGRLGRVMVRSSGNEDPDWVARWFDLPIGEVVTNEALTQRIARFNEVSDMTASAQFGAGERFGVSDLVIEVADTPSTQFWSFAETSNAGRQASDLLALGWRMAPVGPWGGRFDLALLHARQGDTLAAGGSWPLGTQGWRLGMSGSASRTKTSDNEAQLLVQGRSASAGLELGRTWVLNNPWVLGTALSWTTSRSNASIAGFELAKNQLNKTSLSATLGYDTPQTRANLKAMAVSVVSGSQRFSYIDTSARFQTALDSQGAWSVRANGLSRLAPNGQTIDADPLALGGTETVRGYDAGAARGQKGAALQLELRHSPTIANARPAEIYAFADHGHSSQAGVTTTLASVGLGLQARISQNLGVDLVVSHQLKFTQAPRNRWLIRLVGSW